MTLDPAAATRAAASTGAVDPVEIERMTTLQDLSKSLWQATSWLLKLLGASAFFVIGLRYATSQGRVAVSTPALISLAAVLLGALAYALIQVVSGSRIKTAQTKSPSKQPAYLLLGISSLAQVAALGISPLFQGFAVYDSLTANTQQVVTDTTLAMRLLLYSNDASALEGVKDYCTKHIADDGLSSNFLNECLAFLRAPAPSQSDAAAKALQLKSSG